MAISSVLSMINLTLLEQLVVPVVMVLSQLIMEVGTRYINILMSVVPQ